MVAVYGRRRVGKTFLVDEVFTGKFTFRHAGLSPVEAQADGLLRAQLDHFYNSLILFGMESYKKPDSWLDAFLLLEKYLQKIDDGSRQLIFFQFGRLTCEIIDQPNKDEFVRKYIRKDIKCKLTSFRIMFIL